MPEPTLDDLRWVLRTEADDVVVPVPPLDLVADDVAAHRGRRRRRTGLGILAAAVVVGALVVAGIRWDSTTAPDPSETPTQTPDRDLRTLEDLKRGPSTDVAYAIGTKLVLGSNTITFPQPINDIEQAGDSVVVSVGPDFRLVLVDRVTGDSRVLTTASAGSMAIAPDEGVVAWVKQGSATVVLHWLDGTDGENEQTFPAGASCCDNPFILDGITSAGQLIASSPMMNRSWVWDYPRLLLSAPQPGDDVRRIRGATQFSVVDVRADGVLVQDVSKGRYRYLFGALDGDLFRPEVVVDDGERVHLDDAGHLVVDRRDGPVVVRDRADASGLDSEGTLGLPPGSVVQGLRQESEGAVLLDVLWSDGSAYELNALVRCDLEELTCEKVANIPVNQGMHY